jgi:hypothetical protein
MAEHKSTENWGRSVAKTRYGGGDQKAGGVRQDGLPQESSGGTKAGGLVDAPNIDEMSRKMQAPQAPIDRHGPGYDNDAADNSWVRGMGGVPYPHFDAGPSGHRYGGKK